MIVESNAETSAMKAECLSELDADVFIGDTESDTKAALIAKCMFMAISLGFRSEKFFKDRNIICYNNLYNCINQKGFHVSWYVLKYTIHR